jgi:hypothetical protein
LVARHHGSPPGEPSPDQPPAPRTTRTSIHTCGVESRIRPGSEPG